MAGSGQNNWQYATPVNIPSPGTQVLANGGGSTSLVGARDIMDARRMMAGDVIPSAAYPDGYLGTIVSRQSDKMLQNVQSRLNQRNYQRGVHKGERVDPRDYYWTDDVNPQVALEAQARGEKWTQKGNIVEVLAHMGKVDTQHNPAEMAALYNRLGIVDTNIPQAVVVDPNRTNRKAAMLPTWR
jgi:hypothetical protein